MKNRFEFEFDTSVIAVDGNYFTVMIVVDDVDNFEVWDPDRGILVNLSALPKKDQVGISNRVAQRFARRLEPILDSNSGPSYVNWINGGSR